MNETMMRVLRRDHINRLVKEVSAEWFKDIRQSGEWDDKEDGPVLDVLEDCLGDLVERLTEELA